jgi:hypothetical protein
MNLKFLLEFDKWLKKNPQGGIFIHDILNLRVSIRDLTNRN